MRLTHSICHSRLIPLVLNDTEMYNWVCTSFVHAMGCHQFGINQSPKATLAYHKVQYIPRNMHTVFCFAVLCCGYTLTDFPRSIRLTSLALWQSNDCPSASKATLMNMDKYLMWIHYERLHNHNKAKHNKTVCIFLGINCIPLRPAKAESALTNSLLHLKLKSANFEV